MFILDYSVVLFGYRSDFTNTLVVGDEPDAPSNKESATMPSPPCAPAKASYAPAPPCKMVFDAMTQSSQKAGVAEYFPHHGGHGLGLTHPENPLYRQKRRRNAAGRRRRDA